MLSMLGKQRTVRLLPPYDGEDSNTMSHFLTSVTGLSTLYEIVNILIW